jgi:hypothetical protein
MRSTLWTHSSVLVAPFEGSCLVDLPVPCSFDFNVAATKYFAGLQDGDVPLVCPALFDLGERAKVLIVSVTEGDDKPLKYPHVFRASQVLVLNKVDLLLSVSFDVGRFMEHARQVNLRLDFLQVSATRGDGLADGYAWLRAQKRQPQPII